MSATDTLSVSCLMEWL